MIKVYKFSTSTCGPCRMVKPIWDKIVQKNPIPGVKDYIEIVIDNDDCGLKYAQQFEVTRVPTIVITDENDTVLERLSGAFSESFLTNKIKNLCN